MPEVINELLGYENIKIIQDTEMFNFSLDSVLLADFAKITKKTSYIVDLCTGNAPIPLYLTLKTKNKILGVEIQEKVYDLAKRSIELNNLQGQIQIILDDVRKIHKKIGTNKYDLVTCNPPYFRHSEDSNINKNDYLSIARHEIKLTLEQLLYEANRLLKSGGNIVIVHRPDRLTDLLSLLRKHRLEPKKLRIVYPREGKQPVSVLIEAKKDGNLDGLKVLEPLYVMEKNSNKYTEEVLKIFNYGM